jgi:hypothetical protein
MRHGADWRNPAREAVRNVPFLGDLNHGKIQASRRSPGGAYDPTAHIAPASIACRLRRDGNYSSPSAFQDSD